MRTLVALFFCICFATLNAQEPITLQRFLQEVEIAHPTLRAAALEKNTADADVLQAQSNFDIFLKGKYELKTTDGKEKVNYLDAGLEMPLATMFGPRINANLKRGDGASINPENTTNGSAEVGVGVSMPLWQGINTDSRRTALQKALLRPELASISVQQERNSLFRTASLRYWDWVESTEQVQVAQAIFRTAEERFTQIARRARAGEVAAIDSIEALQEVERRRGEYVRSQRNAEQAAITAATFLWNTDGTQQTQPIRPAILPNPEQLATTEIERDRTLSLTRRPEARRILVQEQSAQLDVQLANELQRPLIEAQGQLLTPLNSPALNTFKVGLSISQPLLFRSANAQEQFAQINTQRISYQRILLNRQIQAEIDDALSALNKATERIVAAEREVQLATTMQQAEVKRFTAGESTLIFVNIRERALAEAQARLVTARADYFRAMASYNWATAKW